MKITHVLIALTLALPGSAFAHNCPNLISEIDAILDGKPDLDEETIVDEDNRKNVRQMRDEGEALHNSGKHGESVEVLQRALDLLKSET